MPSGEYSPELSDPSIVAASEAFRNTAESRYLEDGSISLDETTIHEIAYKFRLNGSAVADAYYAGIGMARSGLKFLIDNEGGDL